jgi:2-polyprenyl-3-methyl-5-hydroxy-6-metoxy-1,4-benzoquinol methylase
MSLQSAAKCPVCGSAEFQPFLICKDFTASGESFHLVKCLDCKFILTNPRPDSNSLSGYYESASYISHTSQSTGIVDQAYLLIRNFTVGWKRHLIQKLKPSPSIFDYGCGTGDFLKSCHRAGWKTFGVEPSDKARAIAQETGINIVATLDQPIAQEFDVITMWHVLEHVENPDRILSVLRDSLKDDGMFFIAVPNCESPDSSYYGSYWAAFDVPRHLWHFSKSTMTKFLTTLGLQVKWIFPMKLDAYYVSLLSEKYKNPHQNTISRLFRGALHGFKSNIQASKSLNHSSLIYVVVKG